MKKTYTDRKTITLNEIYFLVFLLLGVLILMFFLTKPADEKSSFATLYLDGEVFSVFELDKDCVYPVSSLEVEIEVLDGKIRFLSSDCKDKICVKTGFIERPNEVAVCLPKKLVLKITEKGSDEIDVVLR